MSAAAASVAEVLPDGYQLVRQIGRSDSCQIWRAIATCEGRLVVIKTLHLAYGSDPHMRERFRREALWGEGLSSPHIAKSYEFVDHKLRPSIVMEYVAGATVGRIAGARWTDLSVCRRLGIHMARGLIVVHDSGLVHRDIKPSNMILSTEGSLKLIDFGIALDARDDDHQFSPWHDLLPSPSPRLTATGRVLATPDYASPEQFQGFTVDFRSDIYSAGVSLYEMVCCERPFEAKSKAELAMRHTTQQPPSLFGKVPDSWARLIRKCLEKNPDDRFQSAEELLYALEGVTV